MTPEEAQEEAAYWDQQRQLLLRENWEHHFQDWCRKTHSDPEDPHSPRLFDEACERGEG